MIDPAAALGRCGGHKHTNKETKSGIFRQFQLCICLYFLFLLSLCIRTGGTTYRFQPIIIKKNSDNRYQINHIYLQCTYLRMCGKKLVLRVWGMTKTSIFKILCHRSKISIFFIFFSKNVIDMNSPHPFQPHLIPYNQYASSSPYGDLQGWGVKLESVVTSDSRFNNFIRKICPEN